MRPRLRPAAGALAVALLFASCESEKPAPEKEPEPAEVFHASDVPEGSSGTLVAGMGDEMLVCRGWGLADHESDTTAGCDTVYDVGSMTKQFTAAAVLRLQMQDRLQVTDPIGRHLGGVPADKRGITVEHLLTHTSGLVDVLGSDYEPLSRADLIADAFASELRTRPGERYHYSNVGYSLLAAIIEAASGTGYEAYLVKELFAPAGMTLTGYVLPEWSPGAVAVEYDAEGRPQGRPFDHPWAADGPYWNLRGNGGLLSTARDMFRWHQALLGELVLDAEAKAALFRPRVLEEPGGDTRYAFGWVVMDTPYGRAHWHNGGNGLSYGEVARLPEAGAFVFWITNQYRGKAGGWNLERDGGRLTQGVIERLLDQE